MEVRLPVTAFTSAMRSRPFCLTEGWWVCRLLDPDDPNKGLQLKYGGGGTLTTTTTTAAAAHY